MSYTGIDYGCGLANRDPKTGIHYGIIPLNALGEFAIDEFEVDYGKPHCPECEAELGDSLECKLHGEFQPEDCYPEDPIAGTYEKDGYVLSMDESNDVWVFRSPFVTRASYCSPCAPGAGYLTSPNEDGPLCYALGPDWFDEENPSPYTATPYTEEKP